MIQKEISSRTHDERTSHIPDANTFSADALATALFPALDDLPRVPQQARSREKRDDILKAAAQLFVERGYSGATSDDIAEAAGVSVGTFYNYFRNKRQALVALVIARVEDIFSNLELAKMDFSHGDQRATIQHAISAVMGSTQNSLRRVWNELMSQNPDLAPYQQIIRRHVLAQVEENLKRAAREGRTWPDLDVEATSLAIFTLLDTMSLLPETHLGEDRLIEALTDMVYRSLFLPEKGNEPQQIHKREEENTHA